jgi:hypothetical protein
VQTTQISNSLSRITVSIHCSALPEDPRHEYFNNKYILKGPLIRARASSVSAQAGSGSPQAAHPQLRLKQQRLRSRDHNGNRVENVDCVYRCGHDNKLVT